MIGMLEDRRMLSGPLASVTRHIPSAQKRHFPVPPEVPFVPIPPLHIPDPLRFPDGEPAIFSD